MSEQFCGLAQATGPAHIELFGNLELLLAAIYVRKLAYAPYSGLKVGAAFRTPDNKIFTGCNVENAAFSPSSCAECTALTKAVSEGSREFIAGAVVAYAPSVFTISCGVCRQFIREFVSNDIPIYVAKTIDERQSSDVQLKANDAVFCTTIFNLLPFFSF